MDLTLYSAEGKEYYEWRIKKYPTNKKKASRAYAIYFDAWDSEAFTWAFRQMKLFLPDLTEGPIWPLLGELRNQKRFDE